MKSSALAAPGGYDYGNARVRAMKTDLFDAVTYERLLTRDIDGLLSALAETKYRPDVDAALARSRGQQALQRALGTHLTRSLRTVAGFYAGAARRAVGLILSRFDIQNVLTILRAHARRLATHETMPLLVPVGALDEIAAVELIRQPTLRSAVDLMAQWGVPGPDVARGVWGVLPAYERTGDLSILEHAVMSAHAASVGAALKAGAEAVSDIAPILREEIDRSNLIVALRVREGHRLGEPVTGTDDRFLPGGRIPTGVFERVVASETRSDVAALLDRAEAPYIWRAALDVWVDDGELTALEGDLGAEATKWAVSLFWRGDPLGIAIPMAYAAAKENEVRNLRLIAYRAESELATETIRQVLVFPW